MKFKPTCTCTTGKTCALCGLWLEAARLWAVRLSDSQARQLYQQSQIPPALRDSPYSLSNIQAQALFERLSPWAPEIQS